MKKLLDQLRNSVSIAKKGTPFVMVVFLSACVPLTPEWDARFGDSVRTAIAQQTIDPQASRNNDPVAGMDGRSANEALNSYYESFRTPTPPPPLLQVNTGASGS